MKKVFSVLVLAGFLAGGVFSQETGGVSPKDEAKSNNIPKNTIIVDVGPTIAGGTVGMLGSALSSVTGVDLSGSGFGIGVHYERNILDNVSAGVRFSYLNLGIKANTDQLNANIAADSFSIEGHGRLYPFSGAFFVDALLGYTNMNMKLTGNGTYQTTTANLKEQSVTGDYFKVGGKIGWKLVFGKQRVVFVFEPSLGYSFGIGNHNAFSKDMTSDTNSNISSDQFDNFTKVTNILSDFVLAGGPRVSLGFGVAF